MISMIGKLLGFARTGITVPGYAAAIPILNGVEVSTAGDRRRLDALFHARLTAGCEG